MDLGIKGKVAIVCGASKGIGFGIARTLAAEGVRVAMTGRNQDALADAAGSIRHEGGDVSAIVADMSTKDGVAVAVDQTREALGDIDIVVSNNFGHFVWEADSPTPLGSFETISDDDFKTGLDDLLMSNVYLFRAVIPQMRIRNWGRLINIGSVAMKAPHHDLMYIANLRAGMCGFVKTLSNEYGKFGITANIVAPGPIDTPTFRHYIATLEEGRNTTEGWASNFVPVGRLGTGDDIGAVTAFLAGVSAGWINGQTITVDGGFLEGLF